MMKTDIYNSYIVLFEAIAKLAGHPHPEARARLAMDKFGSNEASADNSREIVTWLTTW